MESDKPMNDDRAGDVCLPHISVTVANATDDARPVGECEHFSPISDRSA